MFTGPKIVKDSSLIFYYDTDNSKSYVGEPTTNLVTNSINFNGGWAAYYNGNDGMFLTDLGTMGYRMSNQPAWNGIYMNFNLVNSGTYTFSAKIKYWNSIGGCNGGTVYVSNYGAGDVSSAANTSIIGEWQKLSVTVSISSPTNVYFYLISFGGTYPATTNGSSWEVTQPQIELNSHSTSFTQGTRSFTQGLLTLSGTASLDLTNMTYDSSSIPTFNGTSSYISSPHNVNFNILPITIESYVYWTGGSGLDILNKYYSGSLNGYRVGISSGGVVVIYYFRDGSNYIDYAAGVGSVSTNTWYHIVVTFSTIGAVFYINGVVVGTKSWIIGTPGPPTTAQQIEIGRYPPSVQNAFFNGKIALVKIYNKALTSTEVLQNFSATRNRFNI